MSVRDVYSPFFLHTSYFGAAFAALMNAVKSGVIKKIFVYRLDRFSRSTADFSRLWELLDKYGVEFYSATENFDTSSPMGRAMLNIVLVFAQLERLHRLREEMLNKSKNNARKFEKIDFNLLGFNEKKLVAAQFIKRISIGENEVNIEWKI